MFIEQCPELVIVDEAHTCARPAGAAAAQQQRYHLVSRLAAKSGQYLVLLTATPHSGKPEEFQSLLGLVKPEFGSLDIPSSSQSQRRELAKHFVQRKRADVERWLGEDTPFPRREAFEWSYSLGERYASLFDEILDFARKLVAPDQKSPGRRKRVQYWTALALLRGVMSSPAAGVQMLTTRLDKLGAANPGADDPETAENPVADSEELATADNPLAVDLCKVALWLEAHNPGEPLNFLDHHIKCGNAIVGFVKREEVDAGVPDEAFAKLPGDDPEIGKEIRARNKRERKDRATGQAKLAFTHQRETELAAVLESCNFVRGGSPGRTDASRARPRIHQ